jgi:hypothetical protein
VPISSVIGVGAPWYTSGHPHVVRHDAELERDAGHDEHEPEHQQRAVALPASVASAMRSRSSEPGRAVDHRHPVEQHPDASAPSTKYFIAASVGRRVVALQRDQRVQRQRHELEPR